MQGKLVLLTVILAVLIAAGLAGLEWRSRIDLRDVKVSGNVITTPEKIAALARLDSIKHVFDVTPSLIEDRIVRDPWIERAVVSRFVTGRVAIEVSEREPVLLALNSDGEPGYYIDKDGFMMPATDAGVFDVPIVRGLPSRYHAMKPIDKEEVLILAGLIGSQSTLLENLFSEFLIDESGEVTMYTAPSLGQPSIPVVLGHGKFAEKLRNFEAFWNQYVRKTRLDEIQRIDLRFDSQIITIT